MLTEKNIIKCESVFNEDRTHRYVLRRVWDAKKPLLAVIMLNASISDTIVTDTTTTLVMNNVARLEEYGGVHILNLYSILTNKLNFRFNSDDDLNHPENDTYIKKSAEECDKVVLAWGKTPDTIERVGIRANQVMELLTPYADKLYVITDGERRLLHPLVPALRNGWCLEKYTP